MAHSVIRNVVRRVPCPCCYFGGEAKRRPAERALLHKLRLDPEVETALPEVLFRASSRTQVYDARVSSGITINGKKNIFREEEV